MRDDKPVVVNEGVENVVEEMRLLGREIARVDLIKTLLQIRLLVVVVHGGVAVTHKHRATST